MTVNDLKTMDIPWGYGYPSQRPSFKGKHMKKKIKYENDIHWTQSLVVQGKNVDIPWISRISIFNNTKGFLECGK